MSTRTNVNNTQVMPVVDFSSAQYRIFEEILGYPEFEWRRENGFLNKEHERMQAGALCLYSALLFTSIMENDPLSLKPEYVDLKKAERIKKQLRNEGKTVEEIKQIEIKNVENGISHGQFMLYYNIDDKNDREIEFILHPNKSDIKEPIKISSKSIFEKLSNYLVTWGEIASQGISNNVRVDDVKNFIIPGLLYDIANYYLHDGKKPEVSRDMRPFVEFALRASTSIYEQDDYYQLFEETKNDKTDLFVNLSHIRNSVRHHDLWFGNAKKFLSTDMPDFMLNIPQEIKGKVKKELESPTIVEMSNIRGVFPLVLQADMKHLDCEIMYLDYDRKHLNPKTVWLSTETIYESNLKMHFMDIAKVVGGMSKYFMDESEFRKFRDFVKNGVQNVFYAGVIEESTIPDDEKKKIEIMREYLEYYLQGVYPELQYLPGIYSYPQQPDSKPDSNSQPDSN